MSEPIVIYTKHMTPDRIDSELKPTSSQRNPNNNLFRVAALTARFALTGIAAFGGYKGTEGVINGMVVSPESATPVTVASNYNNVDTDLLVLDSTATATIAKKIALASPTVIARQSVMSNEELKKNDYKPLENEYFVNSNINECAPGKWRAVAEAPQSVLRQGLALVSNFLRDRK